MSEGPHSLSMKSALYQQCPLGIFGSTGTIVKQKQVNNVKGEVESKRNHFKQTNKTRTMPPKALSGFLFCFVCFLNWSYWRLWCNIIFSSYSSFFSFQTIAANVVWGQHDNELCLGDRSPWSNGKTASSWPDYVLLTYLAWLHSDRNT